jgi:hypothetical protein
MSKEQNQNQTNVIVPVASICKHVRIPPRKGWVDFEEEIKFKFVIIFVVKPSQRERAGQCESDQKTNHRGSVIGTKDFQKIADLSCCGCVSNEYLSSPAHTVVQSVKTKSHEGMLHNLPLSEK